MKNYSNILRVMLSSAALTAMFSACTFEQEDYFDESAAIRIQHVNDEIKSTLCAPSSANGWVIQYYVAGTDDYDFEGFNLFGKFYESGKVTLCSDHRFLRDGHAGKYTEYTSFYEMLAEEGPVLAFNTWNDIISVFVDPVDPGSAPNTIIDDGEGMNGDDRLVVLSYNNDEVLLRGERHSAPIRFIRLDRSPADYISQTAAMKDYISNEKMAQYYVSNGTDTMYIDGLYKGYFNYNDRLIDPLESSVKNCVFTPDGFRLRTPLVLGADTCQEFVLNSERSALVSGNVSVSPCWLLTINSLCQITSAAKITALGASDSFAAMYNKLKDDITENFPSQTFNGITFGKSSESGSSSRVGVIFSCSSGTRKYLTGFTGTVTIDPQTGMATIQANPDDPSSNYSSYSRKGIGSSFTDIVSAMNGTYRLYTNNVFKPTEVSWTKVDDPSFYFVTQFDFSSSGVIN
ncbi:MAG: DUF4302 domain-containing protein [Bacteroidales bacterium]|nr:DUF4302 domain-containing protein [Bacteroidales bacterium]